MPTQTNIGSYKGVPIKPGTQAEVNAQVAAINAQQQPNPTVQANPANGANLQGTMTTPQAPKAPVVPQVAPMASPVTQPTKTDPMAFNQVISAMRDKLAQDDKLTKVKNLVFTQLYDRPLTSEEKKALTPALQHAMETGDRNLIDTEVRLLNDQIKGRTNTLDQSLKYLVDGYKESVAAAETQKQDAIDNVLNFAQVYGSNAGTALKSLYGDQYLQSLKDMGIDVNNFSSLQTLAERKATEGSNTPTPGYNGEFAATIDLMSNTGATNQQRQQIKGLMQNFIANGDYGSAYALVQQTTSAGLKGAAGTTFQQQTNSVGVLDDLKKAIDAYAATGGNTNIFKGTADQIQTKIGKLLTDPKYAALAVQLNAAFQNYRLQMTGAAFGPKESAEYASILPSPGNTLDLNQAKLEGASNYLNSSIDSSIKSVVGPGGVYIKQYAEGAIPNKGDNNSELSQLVEAKGYDYPAMKAEGYTDDEIKTALGL